MLTLGSHQRVRTHSLRCVQGFELEMSSVPTSKQVSDHRVHSRGSFLPEGVCFGWAHTCSLLPGSNRVLAVLPLILHRPGCSFPDLQTSQSGLEGYLFGQTFKI